MGEYKAVIERLNKILIENGFAKLHRQGLYPPKEDLHGDGNGIWKTGIEVRLWFDSDGKYIKPQNGDYPESKIIGCLI
jgi:hypothetical protein